MAQSTWGPTHTLPCPGQIALGLCHPSLCGLKDCVRLGAKPSVIRPLCSARRAHMAGVTILMGVPVRTGPGHPTPGAAFPLERKPAPARRRPRQRHGSGHHPKLVEFRTHVSR